MGLLFRMRVRLKYRYRVVFYFVILLVFVALAFTVYMSRQNRSYSLSTLQTELKNYSADLYELLSKGTKPQDIAQSEKMHFTLLDTLGMVLYDSREKDESYTADQSNFYEVIAAKTVGEGSTLRASSANSDVEYLYYAKKYGDKIIKAYIKFTTLKPTQIETDNTYFLIIGALLCALIAAIIFITGKLVKPLKSYTQLTEAIKNNADLEKVTFDNDDFGEVGQEIASTFVQLDKAKRYKQKLTQNIAHELKTPVTAIKAYLETILQDENMPEEQKRKFIQNSYNQASRLADLIAEVSTLNKLDEAIAMKNKQTLYPIEQVNFTKCIKEIMSEIGFKFKERNVLLENNIDQHLEIRGCKSLIYSLFKNLIDNSLEHSGGNCKITIAASAEQNENGECGKVSFTYSDTGKGIPHDALDRVFERFYRADNGRTRKAGEASGSGLGLSIVKNAVAFHKGTINVTCPDEGGVVFKFNLFSLS